MLIIAIISCAVSAISVIIMAIALRYTRTDRHSKRLTDTIISNVKESLHPFDQRVLVIEQRTGEEGRERDRLLTKGMIAEALHPLEQVVAGMDAKVSTLWDQLPLIMAKMLHQPNPARARIDRLLEAFLDGTLTADDRLELRKALVIIQNWKPESVTDFPIHPGEPAMAAILLLTMDDPPASKMR